MAKGNASGPTHWADLSEGGVLWGIRLLLTVYRHGGRWPFRLVLWPVVLYFWLSNGRARRASSDFLSRVHRATGLRPGSSFAHFLSFGDAILDKLLATSGELPAHAVKTEGAEVIHDAMSPTAGRGGLILTAHWGNLELARAVGGLHPELVMNVLVHTRHAQRYNGYLKKIARGPAVNLLQVTEINASTAVALSERIGRGEWVAMAADRIPVSNQPRVAMVPFFGEPAPFPVGPFVLAALLQCPVFLVHCAKVGDEYVIYYQRFRERVRLERQRRSTDLEQLVGEYAGCLERLVKKAPLQWFNFFDFWTLPKHCVEAVRAKGPVEGKGSPDAADRSQSDKAVIHE